MVDATYSRAREHEELATKILEREYQTEFEKRAVELQGIDGVYEFDIVSKDGYIVGEIKSSQYKGGRKSSAIARLSDACLFLLRAEGARKRLLVLTDKSLYDLFKKERQGRIVEDMGVEIKYVDLMRVIEYEE